MNAVTREWLSRLPKIELHCHLDGSMRAETVWELAQQQGLRLPASGIEELKKVFHSEKSSLRHYLTLFQYTVRVLQEREAIQRAVIELLEDFAAENGKYIEIRYAPLLHLQGGMKPEEVVEVTLAGIRDGCKRTGVRAGLILCCMRNEDPRKSFEVSRLAALYKNAGVVALDLAGPERGHPASPHRRAFEQAKEAGLLVTIHAAEDPCPEHIAQALEMGADRIGHGLYLKDANDEVKQRIIERSIPLEMCPTSNLETARLRDYREHPIKSYYDAGVKVTISTDNRLMSNTTLTDELEHVARAFDLRRADIGGIVLNSARSAFIYDEEEKRRMIESVKDMLS